MRLIHLTDPHLSSLSGQSFRSMRGKRKTGYLSWSRKRQFIHRRETLEQLTHAVHQESPDQVILTGDVIQVGLAEEVAEVAEWLRRLAPADQLLFVPGNHDVYATGSWIAIRNDWNFILPPSPATSQDSSSAGYPVIRTQQDVALIGISTACVTPVFSARGEVGEAQRERIKHALESAEQQDQLACLAMHHPPLQGMSKWRKSLRDTSAMEQLLQQFQPAMVLCGHLHHNEVRLAGTQSESTRVYCTASASDVSGSSFRVVDIHRAPDSWEITMTLKTWQDKTGRYDVAEKTNWQVQR